MVQTEKSPLDVIARKLARRSDLTDEETAAILGLPHRIQRMDAGAYLVREGDEADRCCALLSGFAYRHRTTGQGSRQIMAIQMEGDLIDLQNSMLGCADHNVQMLTAVTVALIPHKAIAKLADDHPGIAHALWRDTLVDGAIAREWMMNIGRRDARQRVAHLLCEMAFRQDAAGIGDGPDYGWPMTQEQVGDALGLTAVHVNRTLQSLRADKLVSTGRSNMTVMAWDRLQRVGDFSSAYLHEPVRTDVSAQIARRGPPRMVAL